MTTHSVSSHHQASPWQALQGGGSTSSSGSQAGPAFNDPSFWPQPANAVGGGGSADAGSTGSSDSDGGISQFAASLQSFLTRLQSGSGTDATGTAGSGSAAVASGSGASASITMGDLFGDLSNLLGALENAGSTSTAPGQASGPAADGSGLDATASMAQGSGQTDDTDGPHHPHGPHHMDADMMNAVQSYAAQANPATLTATTSLTA